MRSPKIESGRLKVTLRLAINRLKLLKEKNRTENKILRRTVAKELESGKESSAKVKTEKIIRVDYFVEALDILENYCDLLVTRIDLIESKSDCDENILGIVVSIIYASARASVKELETIRDLLTMKYGRDFVTNAMDDKDEIVDPKLKYKLDINPPDEKFVNEYLSEIARGYKIRWGAYGDSLGGDDDGDNGSGGLPEKVSSKKYDIEDVEKTPSKDKVTDSDNNDNGSTDILNKLPSTPPSKVPRKVAMSQEDASIELPSPRPKAKTDGDDTPSLDELMSRFEALKRR
ncbi:Vacuolar protein sorting-associated protein ist1 [Mycoemilia scoparia]|uniref:Vacuolar protein sorting-associated protein ist1 n=1 Tax=Mycoemilia scoparia TaxID=417184 RepID=A0A9W8DT22_9FUNG|nr:Vacuolar protein sorting-associated protein ist1 [Mycoemilia scoparia]